MLKRRILKLALAAAAIASAAGLTAASSAAAQTPAPAAISASLAAAHAAEHGFQAGTTVRPDVSTATLRFLDGSSYPYDCSDGKTWSVNATVTEVLNACGTRVWLHQYNNNTGVNWCTSKVSASYPPEIKYANLYISSNSAPCTTG
jgi:hypothetical protein